MLKGLRWLLEHGADPNVPCGDERESSLHVAARRGQAPEVVRLLLDHGADVHARRGDGRTAWLLAVRNGFGELAELLDEAREELAPADELLAACGRGDVDTARRLAMPVDDHRMLPEAASRSRHRNRGPRAPLDPAGLGRVRARPEDRARRRLRGQHPRPRYCRLRAKK